MFHWQWQPWILSSYISHWDIWYAWTSSTFCIDQLKYALSLSLSSYSLRHVFGDLCPWHLWLWCTTFFAVLRVLSGILFRLRLNRQPRRLLWSLHARLELESYLRANKNVLMGRPFISFFCSFSRFIVSYYHWHFFLKLIFRSILLLKVNNIFETENENSVGLKMSLAQYHYPLIL